MKYLPIGRDFNLKHQLLVTFIVDINLKTNCEVLRKIVLNFKLNLCLEKYLLDYLHQNKQTNEKKRPSL